MKKNAVSFDSKLPTPKEETKLEHPEKLHIGREFMDVTWRIAVPVVLLAAVGLLADKTWGTKPWLTVLGTIVGFLFAALLVKRQIGDIDGGDGPNSPDNTEGTR